MSSPQKEYGHIQIATGSSENDILSALIASNLNGTEWSVAMHVIRKTWGWNKKEDWISLSQFQKALQRDRCSVIRAIKSLVSKKILVSKKTLVAGGKLPCTIYSFNKQFDEWVVSKVILVSLLHQTSIKNEHQLVSKVIHTKETITKENIQKKYNECSNSKKSAKKALSLSKCSSEVTDSASPPEVLCGVREVAHVASTILGCSKMVTSEGKKKYKARLKTFTHEQILDAFRNLPNEPDHWKLKNVAHRPLAWWLKSDSYIEELLHLHLKQSKSSSVFVG